MTVPRTEADMIALCNNLWKGGYLEGDPLDPYGESHYQQMGYISFLYAIYQVCIKPYIAPSTNVLEIGCGRGAWTKTMLSAHEIWCLDTQSADHNGFWQHIGRFNMPKVGYLKVSDFSCKYLPDNHFDYLFSYGTFCHIPPEGQELYYRNLFPKLKSDANAFIMFADFDKYNLAIRRFDNIEITIGKRGFTKGRKLHLTQFEMDKSDLEFQWKNRWFHAGISETCQLLSSIGYQVINPDIGLNVRDSIIHFRKL